MEDLIEKMAKAYWDNGKLPIGYKQAFWRVLEAISASGTHAVVPMEATEAMCFSAMAAGFQIAINELEDIYKAMITARPRE